MAPQKDSLSVLPSEIIEQILREHFASAMSDDGALF